MRAALSMSALAIVLLLSYGRSAAEVTLVIDDVGGDSRAPVEVGVRLETDESVAGTQNDIAFESETPIRRRIDGRPNCVANDELNKDATVFSFQPPGCSEFDCTGVRALVLSLSNVDPIPSGSTLYSCSVQVGVGVISGAFPLRCSGALASDSEGESLVTTCVDGSVSVVDCHRG